ncbi:MAG: DNA internalization-related competence protein ComEC/Rec2 [Gammaproteobacteria bacterium]|nr:DNA internalization-related competence protein ComEC/Rec2 [Gammaproteobacteria bacterium]MBU1645262.1 DNA internalization-related competence protein ComEC/Rec2 [Gammaproteobacteria bacterium]MBU1971599.1 DNA internalization-related competence protein ComEC/Rec2 [Gammaproteobacteria bacterium]
MRTAILAFAAGIAWLQWQPSLPPLSALGGLAVAGILLLAALRLPRWRVLGPVGAFLLGIAWSGLLADIRLNQSLPPEIEGRDIAVVGVVAGLPQRFDRGLRFDFDVETAPAALPQRISLAWYRGFRREEDDDSHAVPELRVGERWQLTVRLKRPHGNLNPHGFDYEAWLFERGIRATGYVRPARSDEENSRLDEFVVRPGYVVEKLRETVRRRFERVLGDPQAEGAAYAGVLTALAIGDQRAIDADLWRVFARTGTTHLMSISGLHVTMVAALAWWLASWLWRRSARLPLLLPAQKAAALAGFLAAFIYCLLAGFAVPAQRTLYMLGVVALALWSGRSVSGSRVLALALLLVLLLDPWAVLAAGFWLSFGAVGLIFYIGGGRLANGHWLATWLRTQWAITLGMIPALLALFQQFSLASPLANALAIPLVSLLVTPLALVGTLPFSDPLLLLAHSVLAVLMAMLQWLAAADWSMWQQHAPPAWAVIVGAGGTAWLLLPQGFPARWLGLVMLLPLFFVPPERPGAGEARVVTLDVGQGLAVHVQTAGHDLLFDTGPAFSADANSGNRIIVPYLRAAGVRRLDRMIVSHADRDHSGGALSVAAELPVAWMLSSLAADHEISTLPLPQRRCSDGESWEWDGVRFELLHPEASDYERIRKSNDLSCVLKVTAAGHSLLLTSDVEARAEAALLARHRPRLAADALLVPHHGSRTSSTPDFVAAVAAKDVIFPVGYRNRFGHPKAEVVARYAGVRQWRSDRDGALSVRLGATGVNITAERAERQRYWHGG